MRTSPVWRSMMTSSGCGTGSGPVVPLRARSASRRYLVEALPNAFITLPILASALRERLEMVPFPLYHGTSTYYLNSFRPGKPPSGWPHKEVGVALLKATHDELSGLGIEVGFYIHNIINHSGEHSNWQH